MAALTEGTRILDCPTCHYLTPYPEVIDEPVCVKCLQREWPDDYNVLQAERETFLLLVKVAIGGLFILAVSAILSKLGYL